MLKRQWFALFDVRYLAQDRIKFIHASTFNGEWDIRPTLQLPIAIHCGIVSQDLPSGEPLSNQDDKMTNAYFRQINFGNTHLLQRLFAVGICLALSACASCRTFAT